MDLQIPLLVIGRRRVLTMSTQFTNRRVTHLRFDVVLSRYGIWNGVRMFVRSLGWDPGHHEEVWRIRFIYRKSFSKFENYPVYLWKVLEGSRKVRKKSPWKVESQTPPSLAGQPKGGGVPGGLHLRGPATPSRERGESHPELDSPIRKAFELDSYSFFGQPQMRSTYIQMRRGRGPATPLAAPPKPPEAGAPAPLSQTLAAPPHTSPTALRRALPEFSTTTATTPSCCQDSDEDLLLPLPAGTGRRTSSSTPNV